MASPAPGTAVSPAAAKTAPAPAVAASASPKNVAQLQALEPASLVSRRLQDAADSINARLAEGMEYILDRQELISWSRACTRQKLFPLLTDCVAGLLRSPARSDMRG